ncbi:MAG: MFS transporter [Bacteroidia bacterium]|nr:MFS transporter [Bacteroidia bacterium]
MSRNSNPNEHSKKPQTQTGKKNIALLIVVASLGYFVDIYDLILYNIIKIESLESLGIPLDSENVLFRWQMAGMLIGGLLWGIWGDRKGRVSVLFGSILLYSVANIANAFATDIFTYSLWRFVAGIGLAGELGAAITLVSETMPQKKRGIGTMIIVTVGALGAVFAYTVSEKGNLIGPMLDKVFSTHLQNWQISYIIGGVLGILLLVLRAGTFESSLFHQAKSDNIRKGDITILFKSWPVFKKYLACILIGLPVWYVVGIVIALSHRILPEIGLLPNQTISTKELLMFAYIGLSSGDLLSGVLSQLLQSRKKVIYLYLVGIVIFTSIFLFNHHVSAVYLKVLATVLGAATGYWALFVTNASEQFGTNIRSTVTATVPNFVRFGVVPLTLGYEALVKSGWFANPNIMAAAITGIISIALAWWGTSVIKESFHNNLDYYEK